MNTRANILGNRVDRIQLRRGVLGCGAGFTVALDDKGGIRYTGENRWGQAGATAWQNMLAVFCGQDYVLGLCGDGTVLREGRNHFGSSEIESWACVSTLSCGTKHAAALIGNGRVLCAGDNGMGQCETQLWRDVVDVCCGRTFTAGLREDGTVILAGGDRGMAHLVDTWRDVAGLFSDFDGKHLFAITRTEGKLLSTAFLPIRVRSWRHLVCCAVSAKGMVGVTSRGRILSTNASDRRVFDSRTGEYVACALGWGHVAALCKSGEVISVGRNEFGQTGTLRWGNLYRSFESFSTARREAFAQKERTERNYQRALSEATRHARRLSCGERLTACIQADGHVSATAGLNRVKKWEDVCSLSCGSAHILALHKDGRVSADGNNVGGCCRVEEWKNGKAVWAGKYHSLCLTEDGRVLFAGWNVHGQGNVTEWKHIRLLRGTDTYTVGVDVEGNIFTSGKKLPFDPAKLSGEDWKDLVDVAVSEHHIVGLRSNGRVVTLGDETCRISPAKDKDDLMMDVSSWRGIRAIAAGESFTVGLCYGGRVVAAGRNDKGQCDTALWQHAVYIGCGRSYTAALLADGTVVTTGQHRSDLGWKETPGVAGGAVMAWEKAESTGYEPFRTAYMADIFSLCAGPEHLVAVDRHGQVMAEGLDTDGQCTSASAFLLFRDIRQLDGFGIFGAALRASSFMGRSGGEGHSRAEKSWESGENAALAIPHEVSSWQEETRRLMTLAGQGLSHTAYLRKDNRVCVLDHHDGAVADVESWKEAQMVACGTHHIVGLMKDGTLAATGRNHEGQCDVAHTLDGESKGFSYVACHHHTTVAVTCEGDPVVYGKGYGDIPEGIKLQSAACGIAHMVAVTDQGNAWAAGDNSRGQCDVDLWKNIVAVAVGEYHSVGLCADGSVVAAGDNSYGQCSVDDLSDVRAVACLPDATLCVDHSGRVWVRGSVGTLKERLAGLENIRCLYAHEYRLSALTVDGQFIRIV